MNERIEDFSILHPANDPERLERMVRAIMQRAEPELARRRAAITLHPVQVLAAWTRPALAAAAVLALTSLGALTVRSPDARPAHGVAESLGYPAPVSAWLALEREPTVEELVISLEDNE